MRPGSSLKPHGSLNMPRTEGECWWDPELRMGAHMYYTYSKNGRLWATECITGWRVSKEDRGDDEWAAIAWSGTKTVVGTLEEAKQFVEVSFALELAND